MPKLWTETVESHRREVREAIMDTTWALAVEHGLLAVTMSQIAERVGIGRATLYKYFPDVESILHAWHERQISEHLGQLAELRDQDGSPLERLHAIVHAYALIAQRRGHQDPGLGMLLHRTHRGDHASHVRGQLTTMIGELLAAAAQAGEVRADLPPESLASYCLHAADSARDLSSEASVRQLTTVILAGLTP